MLFNVWTNTTLLFYFNLLMSLARQMDRRKAMSTTFFGRFCVWENHVLCFARGKIDIVQIEPPLSCHFCWHGLVLASIQKIETHNIRSPPHITMFPKYKKIAIKLLPNVFNYGRNHIYIYKVPSPTTSHIYRVKILNNNENEVPQMTKC